MHTRTLQSIGFSIACTAACLVSGAVCAASFSDIGNSPYKNAIDFLQTNNVITGYGDGTFHPTALMSRAELLKMIVASKAVPVSPSTYHDCFPDVTTQWFAPVVCYAKTQGWISGYRDGTFKPDNVITIAEAIKIVIAANGAMPVASPAQALYADVQPSSWYAPFVSLAKSEGLLSWATKKTLGANTGMPRGTASEMLYMQMTAGPLHFGEPAAQTSSLWSAFTASMHRSHGGGQPTSSTQAPNTTTEEAPSMATPSITFTDITKNYGDAPFTLSPTSDSDGTFSFISGNTAVATVSGNTVTIVGAGTGSITATQTASGNFTSGMKAITLTVNRIAPTITLADMNKHYGDAPFTLAATSNSSGAITYASSNSLIASVSGSTVTILDAGSVTITATQAASGNYTLGTKDASLSITVINACASNPCNSHGTCTRTTTLPSGALNSYSCTCDPGWTGANCDTIYLDPNPAAFAPHAAPVDVACRGTQTEAL